MKLKDPNTGELKEAHYHEHPHLFTDADFIQSSSSPPTYFNCVAVAHKEGMIAVRSSYDEQKRTIYFNEDEWGSFISGVKKGEFDFGLQS